MENIVVEKLVAGGRGMGRLADGRICFVAGVLPGETVAVEAVRQQRHYVEGVLRRCLTPSPHRVQPSCPVYGRCGGCQLQHVAYPQQVVLKEAILLELLQRAGVGEIDTLRQLMKPSAAARTQFGYRQRIKLHVDPARGLGYYAISSKRLVPITHCPLARADLNGLLARLVKAEDWLALLAELQQVRLLDAAPHGPIILLTMARRPRPREIARMGRLAAGLGVTALLVEGRKFSRQVPYLAPGYSGTVVVRQNLPSGDHGTITLEVEAGGFCQVNPEQNRIMVATALEWLTAVRPRRLIDLFCGVGNFSLPLAPLVDEVIGVDLQRAAIRCAQKNSESAGRSNCHFIRASALEGARQLSRQADDCILLDPPRQGCAELLPELMRLRPAHILYISCDPATLARDLAGLTTAGYQLVQIRLIDMFPQTAHLEAMVFCRRIGPVNG